MPEPRDPLLKVLLLIFVYYSDNIGMIIQEFFDGGPSAGAGQRTFYGPPAVVKTVPPKQHMVQ